MLSLHEPQFDRDDEELLVEVLRSTWVSMGGPYVEKFEKSFAEFVGAPYAVSVASGTVGLQLAVEVLRRRTGVEEAFDVLVPTVTFIATANAIIHAGGRPVCVDVDRGRLNAGDAAYLATLEQHYVERDGVWRSREGGRRLLAAMPVHVMGWSGHCAGIARALAEARLPVIEDAAESLGSFTKSGRHVGADGIMAVYSFNGNKILTTGGGGMVTTADADLAWRLKHVSTTAKTDGLRYLHDEVGYNFRMTNLLAALGYSQLRKLPARLDQKRRIAARYAERLCDGTDIAVHSEPDCEANNWLVNAVFAAERHREAAFASLRERKVEARPLWTPLHLQPALRAFEHPEGRFPNAVDMWKRTLSLPSSPHLKESEVDAVCDVIRESRERLA